MKRARRVRIVVSFRNAPGRLARFMTGSFAVHGALLGIVLVVPSTRHRITPVSDSMVVALAGPLLEATAPRGGAASAPIQKPSPPPEPKPQPPPKEAHTVREVPKAKPAKPKDKPVKPTKEPDQAPETDPGPVTPPPAESKPPDEQNPGESAGRGGSAVTATVGSGDSSLGWYGAAVKAALESVWVKPYLEDAAGTVSVVVTFDIARDGTSRNIRIQQSSGIPTLDRSAQRAAIEASPFPAVPPTWTEATMPVTMRFDLSPETR